MNWVKTHYDQFTLALLSVGVLGAAYILWSKTETFKDTFADAVAPAVPDNKIAAVDTAKIDEARERFEKPTTWQPREIPGTNPKQYLHSGLLFTSERYLLTKFGTLEKPTKGSLYNDSLTGKPMENTWFIEAGLPLLDSTVPFQDPDADGFLNEDEWRHQTDPNKKESHPLYETKLFLKQWLRQPFRFKFQAHDYERGGDVANATFQINPLDAGGRTKFVKLNDAIEGTNYKVVKFEFKEADNPGTGDKTEVSELTIENNVGDRVILVLNKVIDSPTQFAQFEYFWNKRHGEPGFIYPPVRKLQDFALQPKVDQKDLYKLLDVNEAGALIQRPDGQQYQVPLVPKK